ncbi:neuron navigator 1-like isoform X2 [Arapaima gigas]
MKTSLRNKPYSSIPLPNSTTASTKPHFNPDFRSLGTSVPSHFSSNSSRGPTLRKQLLLQQEGFSTLSSGTCSASSTPRVQRREVPRSKDTLDVHPDSLSQTIIQDLKRSTNKNCRPDHPRHRQVDNANSHRSDSQAGRRGARPPSRLSNNNLCPRLPSASLTKTWNQSPNIQNNNSDSILDEEMGTPEDGSPVNPGPLPPLPLTFCPLPERQNLKPPRYKQPPQVNMAAVAPFWHRLQVQDDSNTSSLEDISDCSSDSMEVCCEDLGELIHKAH